MPVIDAHHHFWHFNTQDFGWIDDAMRVIRRDYLPEDLASAIKTAGVDGVVSVQARQAMEETEWLLELARNNSFVRGVVGWVPLIAPDVEEILHEFSANPKLRAVRHVLQREPDGYMLRDDFNHGIAALKKHSLAYDILIFERHLPQAIELVDRHPQQTFVLDHVAKPRIKENFLEPWRKNIRELARRPNVYCKISGMVTEADYTQWTEAQLLPYFETVLNAFGPKRLMLGSDWPVCLVACEYARWVNIMRGWIKHLSPVEQARILGETAMEAYRL
ncbi:MAG TPA: amidohydrolase family protein [Opitutales bacterium]|jgi:L-fuconolactonase|nr:amidohydrolase family protein [Opitutales bacterium]